MKLLTTPLLGSRQENACLKQSAMVKGFNNANRVSVTLIIVMFISKELLPVCFNVPKRRTVVRSPGNRGQKGM